ncbi:MAG: hypothetical protein ABW200_03650, partial [Hyphomicrobiaceae bacterium]
AATWPNRHNMTRKPHRYSSRVPATATVLDVNPIVLPHYYLSPSLVASDFAEAAAGATTVQGGY